MSLLKYIYIFFFIVNQNLILKLIENNEKILKFIFLPLTAEKKENIAIKISFGVKVNFRVSESSFRI